MLKVKDEIKEKVLYTCESNIDSNEYKKFAEYFPITYWACIKYYTILSLMIAVLAAVASFDLILSLDIFIIVEVYFVIYCKVKLKNIIEKSFNKEQEKGRLDTEYHTDFYNQYLIRAGETIAYKINYSDIDRCIETDTNFYIKCASKNFIIIIQKNKCDSQLINFIRENFDNYENHIGNVKCKRVKKNKITPFIQSALLFIFCLTIMSSFSAQNTTLLLQDIVNANNLSIVSTMWAYWLWLPIPILSIILGVKYKKSENIAVGIVVGIILLICGSFWLIPILQKTVIGIII